jgi:hypothetical protein
VVNALVGVSDARARALTDAGQLLPTAVSIRALIDTGASCTCLDPTVIASLGLPPTGSASIFTPSTGATPHATDQFDVAIAIPSAQGQAPLVFPIIPVVASNLSMQGIQALFGRDILGRCVLVYNGGFPGTTGLFTIAF